MAKRKKITKASRIDAYAAAAYLSTSSEKELGIQIPFDVYLQDPLVEKNDPKFGFDEGFFINWEPGISDGPTSARFAVVDYNGDTGTLIPKAKWDSKQEQFLDHNGCILDRENSDNLQFHQVNVWAVLQRALAFFEGPFGLGRRIPFGFEGDRLIVVPHAGYGQNAFYDRLSKSLQFYYFEHEDKKVYTCLSTDIINHEFGHAVLDGIRPYFFESNLVETGAFHEFMGDLTAILIILRNNEFRHSLVEKTDGRLEEAKILSSIAQEFGEAVSGKPYLRSAQNTLKMSDVSDVNGPHDLSQVLTGAMFDILLALSKNHIERDQERSRAASRESSVARAFWETIQLMQRIAIQPLDLLPPVDVTFKDYALAVLRAYALSNPTDPHGHYDIILKAFKDREILNENDVKELKEPKYLYHRVKLDVYHDIDSISRSRAAAYRFLDDNRSSLLIPAHQNVIVADLYDANKYTRQGRHLPRQIILVYIWREEVPLIGSEFQEYEGEYTTLLCGGTIVFDDKGSVLSWFRKPGVEGSNDPGNAKNREAEFNAGKERRELFLRDLKMRINSGLVGAAPSSSKGVVGKLIPPIVVSKEGTAIKFQKSPHLSLTEDIDEHSKFNRKWQISS